MNSGYSGGGGMGMNNNKNLDDEDRKLFLGGLSWETTEEDLRAYFQKFGAIEQVSIKFDSVTRNPRGFGFITFGDESSITSVLSNGPHTVRDKTIDPKRAKSRPICKKVFVGGIEASLPEDEIKNYFQQYGPIEGVELPFDRVKQKRREFCFIIFDTEEAADIACRNPKQKIGDRECDIKKAQPQPLAQQQKRAQQQYGDVSRPNSRMVERGSSRGSHRGGFHGSSGQRRGGETYPNYFHPNGDIGAFFNSGYSGYGPGYSQHGHSGGYQGASSSADISPYESQTQYYQYASYGGGSGDHGGPYWGNPNYGPSNGAEAPYPAYADAYSGVSPHPNHPHGLHHNPSSNNNNGRHQPRTNPPFPPNKKVASSFPYDPSSDDTFRKDYRRK